MNKIFLGLFIGLSIFTSLLHAESATRSTILLMEKECEAGGFKEPTAALKKLGVKCYPYIDHGGDATPTRVNQQGLNKQQKAVLAVLQEYSDATIQQDAERLERLFAEDFVIIQLGGNAWSKGSHMKGGVAHVNEMFSELYFDIEPIKFFQTGDSSATVVATYRMGGMHMGQPATTFGLSTINLVIESGEWRIQHIHNSGMQAY